MRSREIYTSSFHYSIAPYSRSGDEIGILAYASQASLPVLHSFFHSALVMDRIDVYWIDLIIVVIGIMVGLLRFCCLVRLDVRVS
jgi:hypothetical protein